MTDEEMANLIDQLAEHLGSGWSDIVTWLRANNSLDDIEQAIRARRFNDVLAGLDEAAVRFASDTTAAFQVAAQDAATYLDLQIPDALISFDVANPRAAAWAARNKYELRGEVARTQLDTIHQVVARGVNEGTNPRAIARDVRDSIGLTDYQESIVNNYRRELEAGDYLAAMDRELRDGRYDRSLNAAANGRRTFTPDEVDSMVDSYRQGWVDFRAETISRTEALRAAHEGTDELYQQAIDQGQLDPRDLIRTWRAGPNTEDARDGHQRLDGVEVGMGDVFVNQITGARLRYPGDPSADVSETANCRCAVTTRYKPNRRANPVNHFVPVTAARIFVPAYYAAAA